jgi:cell volume regulation protein A
MSDTSTYGWLVLATAAAGVAALVANRVTQRVRVPAPALMLAAAAVAVQVVPDLHAPADHLVERVVTVALVFILFQGGMDIGWPRFRAAAAPVVVVGVAGTFLTTAAVAVLVHACADLPWYAAVLVATAVAPTDPAVVFSVLGRREVSGRSGTVLEGESGANDPVGIALMASLLSAGELSAGAFGHVAGEFALQMVVGGLVGVVGGRAVLWFMRAVPLPGEGLYMVRTTACALALYGGATVLHGSGFLAVFVAGILLGEARAPYKREIEHFHAALSSLGEIVAFVMLGLTIRLGELTDRDVWVPGLVVGAALALVIRPLVVGPLLTGSGLRRNEKAFVTLAGLKGAVPILLGTFLLAEHVADARRLYGIVVVVVVFSVVVQGSLVPALADRLRVPMRVVEPEPWSVGVRLRDEPHGVHRMTVRPGATADGLAIRELDMLPEDAWISVVVRAGRLVRVGPDTTLQAGDEALVLGDPDLADRLRGVFEWPAP